MFRGLRLSFSTGGEAGSCLKADGTALASSLCDKFKRSSDGESEDDVIEAAEAPVDPAEQLTVTDRPPVIARALDMDNAGF